MSIYSLLSFSVFIAYLYLGIYGLRLNIKSSLNRLFFLLNLSFAVWAFSYTFLYPAKDKEMCWFWLRIGSIGWCSFSGIMLHLFLLLTKNKWLKKWWIYPILYIPEIVFILKSLTGVLLISDFILKPFSWVFVIPISSPWPWMFIIYYLTCVIASILLFRSWGKKSGSQREKKQTRVVVYGTTISLIVGSLLDVILPALEVYIIPPIAIVFVLAWAFGMWYAIIRYRLMVLTPAIGADEIVARMMDFFILLDPYGNIVSMNPKTRELTGYNDRELVEMPVKMILGEIKEGSVYEGNLKTKNNVYIPIQVSASSIKDKDDDIVGMVIVGHDLRQMKQLQAVTKELEAFSYSVAHDLRSPLRDIMGFSRAIVEDCKDMLLENGKDYLEHIQKEGERMDEIIENLLSLSYVGRINMHFEMVNLDIIAQEIADKFKKSNTERNIEFVIKKDVIVHGDSHLLKIVLENLMGNAVKFTFPKEKAKIEFGVENIEDKPAYFVADNGVGFEMEYKDKLFVPFQRLHSLDEFSGSGIGLSIVKRVIDRHNGNIWVKSELDIGTKFYFTI